MISTNNNISPSFKGYDARPLKGFLLTSNYKGIAQELRQIGEKHGFDVFMLRSGNISKNEFLDEKNTAKIFAQDYWSIINNKLASFYTEKKSSLTATLKLAFGLENEPVQANARSNNTFHSTETELLKLVDKIKEVVKSPIDIPAVDGMIIDMENRLEHVRANYRALCDFSHIVGGNFFISKNTKGKDSLLIGEDELAKFAKSEIKNMFGVDNVCVVPQMDNHIDLFLRPLNNGIVLVADESKTNGILQNCVKQLDDLIMEKSLDLIHFFTPKSKKKISVSELFGVKSAKKNIERLLSENEKNNKTYCIPDLDEVEDCLKKSGYIPVRVPASINKIVDGEDSSYQFFKEQYLNYINSCATVNKDGEVVFITNKDSLAKGLGLTDKIKSELGLNFEEIFKNSVKDYIKPENIYFLSGKNNALGDKLLLARQGGIHCATMEIP